MKYIVIVAGVNESTERKFVSKIIKAEFDVGEQIYLRNFGEWKLHINLEATEVLL